jgi:hypothetical protein
LFSIQPLDTKTRATTTPISLVANTSAKNYGSTPAPTDDAA